MRRVLQLASFVSLAGTVVAPALYFAGALAHEPLKTVMLAATLLWFVATPFWMNDRKQA